MADRIALHNYLVSLCSNVYFQAPENTLINYPAILYSRKPAEKKNADNKVYSVADVYQITVISKSPEDPIIQSLIQRSDVRYVNSFTKNNLYQDIFTIKVRSNVVT